MYREVLEQKKKKNAELLKRFIECEGKILPRNNVKVTKKVLVEPVVTEPVLDEPLVSEPVVTEPVVDEPVVAEPVVDEIVKKDIEFSPALSSTSDDVNNSIKESPVQPTMQGVVPELKLNSEPLKMQLNIPRESVRTNKLKKISFN